MCDIVLKSKIFLLQHCARIAGLILLSAIVLGSSQGLQQRLSTAGVGAAGEGMLKVPLEVLQEGAESARFNFKHYFENVFQSPKLNKFLRQGDEAAKQAANSLLLNRMAQMKTILGDEFTETLQKNFMKVVEDLILVRRPDGTIDEFFEGFFKAMEGNPSLMKHADDVRVKTGGSTEPLSEQAKLFLKDLLSDPNPGNPWKLDDIPHIPDWQNTVPHKFWARGILFEILYYKKIYKPRGHNHYPNAPGFDMKRAGSTPEWVQIKSAANPNTAHQIARMKLAIDDLV